MLLIPMNNQYSRRLLVDIARMQTSLWKLVCWHAELLKQTTYKETTISWL